LKLFLAKSYQFISKEIKNIKNFLIALDSFKGTMSSLEAGEIVASAVKEHYPNAKVTVKSFADGGEGTVRAILDNHDHVKHTVETLGADEKKIFANWYFLKDENAALFEMSSVVGLALLDEKDLNPEKTTTFGIAPVILDMLHRGVTKVWFAAGGTSTLDGGLGFLKGMGVAVKNAHFPKNLLEVQGDEKFDFFETERKNKNLETHHEKGKCLFPGVIFDIIADVHAPLLGKEGAVFAFGKQKGATPKNTALLEEGMANFSYAVEARTQNPSFLNSRGLGAAGGIALGLSLLFEVNIKNGADFVMAKTGIKEKMSNFDMLITGEGQFNSQTKQGKGPWALASFAKQRGVPTLIISGLEVQEKDKVRDFYFLNTSSFLPKNKDEAQKNLLRATNKWLKNNEV